MSLEQSLALANDDSAADQQLEFRHLELTATARLRRREEALDLLPMPVVLSFSSASGWARLRAASPTWRHRLGKGSGALAQMALSLQLPNPRGLSVLRRLVACERLASPSFTPPPPRALLETPVGGGIWCLALHRTSNLVFAGCWGPPHQVDLVKCWDAATADFVGSLYGHFSDVKCLAECGQLLYSGSYDGTVRRKTMVYVILYFF